MSDRELQLDAIEISDGLTVADMKRIFGLERPPIDSAARRLEAWATFAGGCNVIHIDGVLYSWDTRPRIQKNGAVIGRVYAQPHGDSPHDAGGYKIDPDGSIVRVPAALRGILPGTEAADVSNNSPAEGAGDERGPHRD